MLLTSKMKNNSFVDNTINLNIPYSLLDSVYMAHKKVVMIVGMLLFLMLALPFVFAVQPSQQYAKIFLNPFYRASMTSNTNYTYTLPVFTPDKIGQVYSAIIAFDIYLTPTVNYDVWVNGQPCNNPRFTVSTTYSGAAQGRLYFDCSNVITGEGFYNVTIKADKNSGSSVSWIDLTYSNQPKGQLTIHGTEYTYGQIGKVWLRLLDSNGTNVNNGVCYVDIYTPLGGYLIEGATMTNMNHDGIYYYDLAVPIRQGVYPAIARCYYQAGQDKRNTTSFALTSGSVSSGTYLDTNSLNLVYHVVDTNKNGGLTINNRVNITYNFSDFYTNCGNISESLITGLTIYWNGLWATGTTNHDISLYVYNYTSNSWITFSNKILGGTATTTQTVTNSISTTNFTKALGINSTNQMRIRLADNDINEGAKKLSSDYIYASCDQLSSPAWQEVKGSSELHVTNPDFFVTDNGDYGISNSINNTLVTVLHNGTVITETYYTGIFWNRFTIQSGSLATKNVDIEYQGLHSIPCNSIISFYKVNDTGYYSYPYTTQKQTTEDHCSINFNFNLEVGVNTQFEAHARNVWESDLRSTNTGFGSIYPLLNGGCTLWQIVKGYPAYVIPKNQTNEGKDYYYRACNNMYDDYYWFNKTYQQSLIDKLLISNEPTYLQYESDYTSAKYAEDKMNIVTNYLLSNLQAVNDYSKLIIENPLGDAVVNTTDQRYWANQSTLYNAWKIVNASCGTGICIVNVSLLSNDVATQVWTYTNRSLTYYPTQTDLTNYNLIQAMVWNATNRNLTYYPTQIDLTNYTLTAQTVWNYLSRNLTYTSDMTNYNQIQLMVWNATNRNLTYYPPQVDMTNYATIFGGVWNYTARNLTYYMDVTNYSNVQIYVWNATSRNLTYYPAQIDMTNYPAIFQGVWNYTYRTITNATNIAESVWAYTNKTVQFANGSINTVQDIKDMGHTYVGGTEYISKDNGKITIRLVRGTGSLAEIELGATCSVSITYPNGSYFVTNASMPELGNGAYYYDFTVPPTLGIYPYFTDCNVSDRFYFSLDDFHVYETNFSSIPSTVWNYAPGRNLTYYEVANLTNVTVNINNTAVAEGVWTYNGTVNSNLLSQFAEYTWTVFNNIHNFITGIWSAPSRTLTSNNQNCRYLEYGYYNKDLPMLSNVNCN